MCEKDKCNNECDKECGENCKCLENKKTDKEILDPINRRFNKLINSMSGLYEDITEQDILERDEKIPYAGYLRDKKDCGSCGGSCGGCK